MHYPSIKIKRDDGTEFETKAIRSFNDGYSHIIIDDGCYQIVNGDKVSSHVFPEALDILKMLPSPRIMKLKVL